MTIVLNLQELKAATLAKDIDLCRPRIDTVLDEFLECGRRSDDDLASSDLVDALLRELLDRGSFLGLRFTKLELELLVVLIYFH